VTVKEGDMSSSGTYSRMLYASPLFSLAFSRAFWRRILRSSNFRPSTMLGAWLFPLPLGDLELVTTIRRNPRRTRANSSIDELRGPLVVVRIRDAKLPFNVL
jgi:hypothetical protein